MRLLAVLFGTLIAVGCGNPDPTPFDATVTYRVRGGAEGASGVTTKPTTTFLVVEKTGRTSTFDGWAENAPKGTTYGRHNFPRGVSAGAIASYYEGLLANAGWRECDVRAEKPSAGLRLLGVTRIDAGADSDEIETQVERGSGR